MAYRRSFRKFGKKFSKVGRARRSFSGLKKRFARVNRSSGFSARGGICRGG